MKYTAKYGGKRERKREKHAARDFKRGFRSERLFLQRREHVDRYENQHYCGKHVYSRPGNAHAAPR